MSQNQNSQEEEEQITYNFNDENEEEEIGDQVKIQLSSNLITINYYQLLKWSTLVKEEYSKSDINSRISQDIQQYQQKYQIQEENTVLFFNSIRIEKVQIQKEKYFDLIKLSKIFKVTVILKLLRKFARQHLNEVDFSINILIDHLSLENTSKDSIQFSQEIENSLAEKINQCFQSQRFEHLPIQIVHRIIEKSQEQFSNDLLYDFIKKSFETRFVLFSFLKLRNLSNQNFNDLYENLINNQNLNKSIQFLPFDFPFLKSIKEENEQLKMNNLQLQEQNDQIRQENEELRRNIEEMQNNAESQIINSYKQLIEELINIVDVDSEHPPQIHKIILPISVKTNNPKIVKSISSFHRVDINSKYIQLFINLYDSNKIFFIIFLFLSFL